MVLLDPHNQYLQGSMETWATVLVFESIEALTVGAIQAQQMTVTFFALDLLMKVGKLR
jgi:hypothetical protein